MLFNFVYALLLLIASPLVIYRALRHGRYRRGVKQKLLGLSKQQANHLRQSSSQRPLVWMHAVSVGEINVLAALVPRLEQMLPETLIVISTSTDTGYDLACQRFGAERVFFCPLDFSWAVKRTFKNLDPALFVLTELELWPNLIRRSRQAKVPCVVINARLSDRSCQGYCKAKALLGSVFGSLSMVLCQDETSANNFQQCGVPTERLSVTGSLKFDGVTGSRDSESVCSRVDWAGKQNEHIAWLVGSTQPDEEAMALRIYSDLRKRHAGLRLILVPRHPERFDAVANLIEHQGFAVHRRSQQTEMPGGQWSGETVILIDTIGELSHWWGVADLATVGGSFGDRGGQNMLEPASYGCAVTFGPDTRNFKDIANRLIHQQAAIRCQDETELLQTIGQFLNDPPMAGALGKRAQQFVQSQRGASEATMTALRQRLSDTLESPTR
ncbi:MAG: 3-deoxy-D-manno-octulosonic acid transferase [Rhodopirellula sp. TMED11]|nr:MAG: 3-deoxy-D-manno-octulosonic acid transferase [Rhodopirellula sp. TMED11]